MNQSSVLGTGGKAQKGWLSRWTRKQWSRHWFVLKNGSLTYYRGPAAELCSFLDGVLDLSLIKHIEVHRQDAERNHSGTNTSAVQQDAMHHHHPIQHYHYLSHLNSQQHLFGAMAAGGAGQAPMSSPGQQQQQQGQFTFSLKMWNGECHLLAASSAAERDLWLESINACANGDSLNEDATSTDSSSSSDSSPTSNLSAKSLDIGQSSPLSPRRNYESSLMAALRRREAEQDAPMLDLVPARAKAEKALQTEVAANEQRSKFSQQIAHVDYKQMRLSSQQQVNPSNKHHQQEPIRVDKSQMVEQDKQVYKRRLMSVQMSDQSSVSDPKLITCTAFAIRPCLDSAGCRLSEVAAKAQLEVAGKSGQPVGADQAGSDEERVEGEKQEQDDDSERQRNQDDHAEQEDNEELDEPDGEDGELESALARLGRQGTPASGQQMIVKQKKRVTFDLSSLASECCYARSQASSSESTSLSDSSEEELDSCSPCSSDDDDDEGPAQDGEEELQQDEHEEHEPHDENTRDEDDCESLSEQAQLEAAQLAQETRSLGDDESSSGESMSRPEVGSTSGRPDKQQCCAFNHLSDAEKPLVRLHASEQQQLLLAARLDEAQTSIGQLERRLNSSYASYSQLEISYKRLQVDLAASREQHKLELAQVQARVDELTRELAASERRLAEMRDKLFTYELGGGPEVLAHRKPERPKQHGGAASSPGQKALLNSWLRANTGQTHHHQPLMLIQHVKQHSINQQTLSMKLLNQSKQIQRKLNELELKVDQIQSCTGGVAMLSSRCHELGRENSPPAS